MTFSITQFRNIAKNDGYLILSPNKKTLAVFSKGEWAEHNVQWRKDVSAEAKKEFIDCLNREFGSDIADLLAGFLPDNGRPLSSRDVVEIIDVGEAYRFAGVGENAQPANTMANNPEIDALIADLDRNFDFESRGRRPRELNREIPDPPPVPPFKRGEQGGSWLEEIKKGKAQDLKPIPQQNVHAPPAIAPQTQPAPAPAPVRHGLQPVRNRGPNPKAEKMWSNNQAEKDAQAKIIQTIMWKEFGPLLEGINRHVDKASAAAANPQLGK